jgi:hypothetical protein
VDLKTVQAQLGHAGIGEVFAGHLRHAHVANLILGDGSIYGLPDELRVTATVIEPPSIGIRVYLLCADADALAPTWVKAVTARRLARYPDQAGRLAVPDFVDGFWEPAGQAPAVLPAGLGRADRPEREGRSGADEVEVLRQNPVRCRGWHFEVRIGLLGSTR